MKQFIPRSFAVQYGSLKPTLHKEQRSNKFAKEILRVKERKKKIVTNLKFVFFANQASSFQLLKKVVASAFFFLPVVVFFFGNISINIRF